MSPLERMAVDLVPCPRCAAGLQARCTTATGNTATYPHVGRMRPVYVAWGAGYGEGIEDEREKQARRA